MEQERAPGQDGLAVSWYFTKQCFKLKKTLKSKVPQPLHHSLSGTYPRDTRSAASGQIRNDNSFASQATFKYRAMQDYNRVPASVRVGNTATVKKKLKQWVKTNIPID